MISMLCIARFLQPLYNISFKPVKDNSENIDYRGANRYQSRMQIENLLHNAYYKTFLSLNDRENEMITSFAEQLARGSTLTVRQGYSAKKLLTKIADNIHDCSQIQSDRNEILKAVQNDDFKHPLRPSVIRKREARHIGDNVLAVTLPVGKRERDTLQKLAVTTHYMGDSVMYLMTLTRDNFDLAMRLLGENSVELDESTEDYLNDCLMREFKTQMGIVENDEIGLAINVHGDELLTRYLKHHCAADMI